MRAVRHRLGSVCIAVAAFGVWSAPAIATPIKDLQQLGGALFDDKTLSHNGNQACSSCHAPAASFTDPDKSHPTSQGDDPTLFGKRNAPTAGYAAFSPNFHFDTTDGLWVGGQFLDGRAKDLTEQAKAPFVGAVEMGNADHAEVIDRLRNGPNAALFKKVYGATSLDDVDDAYDKIAKAIAAFEKTKKFSPFTSKYDEFLRGKVTLDPAEQRGLNVFNDPMKGNCAACHISSKGSHGQMPLFTDFTYDNIGIPKNYASGFLTIPPVFNPDGVNFVDVGLGGTVGDPSLYGAFKVSTLRNIALTAPYGHNGYFRSLEQVVDFYATRDVKPACIDTEASADESEAAGCWVKAEFFDTMNVDELGNLPLTGDDKQDLVAFLETLTDGFVTRVPEPSTLAILFAGFLFAGATIRRR
jgi:cytochrome c peroxidase